VTTIGRDEIDFRWSRGARIGYIAFFAAWCAFLVVFFLNSRGDGVMFSLVPGFMLVFGLSSFVRTLRLSVRTRGDELVVRNTLRTHRLARADIDRFSIGRYARRGQQQAYAELRAGRDVRLMALERPVPMLTRDRDIERSLDRLEAWRTGS
jgi:hypothetical protein